MGRIWDGMRLALLAGAVAGLLILGTTQVAGPATDKRLARSVVLFIGDGMGEGQRAAARYAAVGPSGQLAMDAFPVQGRAHTLSVGGVVTDSAAAATALATGEKTRNGSVGMDPNRVPLVTILELAKAAGMAVGLVTTVQVASATPAAFAAHVPGRSETQGIALALVEAGLDVLLGGGVEDFLPLGSLDACGRAGRRSDGQDLLAAARAAGMTTLCSASHLTSLTAQPGPPLLGLYARAEIPRSSGPSLAEMTTRAIGILSRDPDGFFLLVEEGQIDWACHDNEAAAAIEFTLELDRAVAVAVEYAEEAPPTLLIVTGDHETGGMTVLVGESGSSRREDPFRTPSGGSFSVDWEESGHTARDVPVSALGPGAELLAGVYENTWVFDAMIRALDLRDPRAKP